METAYFAERADFLRSIGLDPDDDDHWSTPDHEIGFDQSARTPVGVLDLDWDYHPETSLLGFVMLCSDCQESPAFKGALCEVCNFRRKRRRRGDYDSRSAA